MQLNLDIKDDKELRNYMKDYLKGLVTTIAREDVEKQIIEAAVAKINNLSTHEMKNLLNISSPEMAKMARQRLDTFAMEAVTRIIEHRINEIHMNSLNEVRRMIKTEIKDMRKEMFKNYETMFGDDNG